ncbi:MAG: rhodanese-related sulfurtransferase, partial [Candidatus Saccharimonadales bacterium]
MQMEKIILFYKFQAVPEPEAVRLWQKTLCEKLNLLGRIIISKDGINGALGGEVNDLKNFVKETRNYFKKTDFKWSDGERKDFPKLSVKVRDEIVTFDAADEIRINEKGVVGGGRHLVPEKVHELIEKYGDEVVFFDGRNANEAAIGKFKKAVVTGANHSRDFKSELDSGKYDELKNKKVITYCTGGIRCEILSVLMKNRGFKNVYQIDGGITKYGEQFGDDGLWEGSLYVFDDRMNLDFSDHAKTIGRCIHCEAKTSNYENCALKSCNDLVLICEDCKQKPGKLF